MKDVNLKVEKMKVSNEHSEQKIETKLKEENEKMREQIKYFHTKVLDKAVKEAVEHSLDKIKCEVKHQSSKVETEVSENKSKSKVKTKKPTKDDIDNDIIKEFENDSEDIFTLKKNCGLDLTAHRCKKCDFETHSKGILRKHKRTTHQLKESSLNIILGFKIDIQNYVYILETIGEELNQLSC
jgi:hypothetical protein